MNLFSYYSCSKTEHFNTAQQVGNEYTDYVYKTWAGDNFKDVEEAALAKDSSVDLGETLQFAEKDKAPLIQTRWSAQFAEEPVDQNVTDTRYLPNSLDPHHTCYLFSDDGKRGQYRSEPKLRRKFEKYIAHAKSLTIHGATGGLHCFAPKSLLLLF